MSNVDLWRIKIGFPSPRGDKLCQNSPIQRQAAARFRPLAGISCVVERNGKQFWVDLFPSPRGDKLCRCSRRAAVIAARVSVPSRG